MPTSPHVRYVASATPRVARGPATSAAYAAGAGPISACDAAHATEESAKSSLVGAAAVANTATLERPIAANTTRRRGAASASAAAGAAPRREVSAIAENSAPISATSMPCTEAASRGTSVARPPDPEKKRAALTPEAAKKSRRARRTRSAFSFSFSSDAEESSSRVESNAECFVVTRLFATSFKPVAASPPRETSSSAVFSERSSTPRVEERADAFVIVPLCNTSVSGAFRKA